MSMFTKTAFGLVLAATAFAGLTATPAAAHDRDRGDYHGYYDNSYQRYDLDGYRDNDRRSDEWRRHHRRHESRHHYNDWRNHDRRDEWRRGY